MHVSFKSRQKKFASAVLSNKMWCYPFKARPRRNLSAFSATRNVACMYTHISLCRELKSGKNRQIFFLFPEAISSLNQDKYFALYWCFCVRISCVLLVTKWGKMDSNEKPQTLVDTFDQANFNSILESVCSSHNFVDLRYPVSTCTAECS